MTRANIRKTVKTQLKQYLKAPRNGKTFNSNVYIMTGIMKKLKNGYEKDFIGQLLEKYYFKYHTRFSNRGKMKSEELKGGSLEKYVKFRDVEGGGFKLKKQEYHAFLQTPEGIKRANFMGPGTELIKRLKRGDKPVSPADMVSLAHDIQYTLAKTPMDIRKADNIMKRDLGRLAKKGEEYMFNIAQGQLIKIKNLAEDLIGPVLEKVGVPNINDLQLTQDKLTLRDRKLLEDTLSKIQKQGFALESTKKRKTPLIAPPPEKEYPFMELEFDNDNDIEYVNYNKNIKKEKPIIEKNKPIIEDIIKTSNKIDDDDLNVLLKKLLNINNKVKPTVKFKGRKPIKLGKKGF